MKRIMLTSVVLAVSLSSALGQSLESMKAAGLEASWKFAVERPLPPMPGVPGRRIYPRPGPVQSKTFQRGGYSRQYDAQAALAQAQYNLGQAGLAVLSAQVYKEANFPFNYGLRIDYLAKYPYASSIQTYKAGAFTWSSGAQAALQNTVANFKAAGYKVILGQVKKQANYPFNYFYEVDYLTSAGRPVNREEVITSQVYPTASTAKWAMDRESRVLKQKGCLILSEKVVKSYNGYYFEIRYRRY